MDDDSTFERTLRRLKKRAAELEDEEQEALKLYRELAQLPPFEQKARIQTDPRCANWALTDLLLQKSHDAGFNEPQEAVHLAELAIIGAARLDTAYYGKKLVSDQLARGWAQLGNAYRICSRFREAERALYMATIYLKRGTGDPLERANILSKSAALSIDVGRPLAAPKLYTEAVEIYRKAVDMPNFAMNVGNLAWGYVHSGRPSLSIGYLREALSLIDPGAEPRINLALHHNLVFAYQEAGSPSKANLHLEKMQESYFQVGDTLTLLRRAWVEGRILYDLRRFELSEAKLQEARQGLIQRGLGLDVALISLDLACLYARQGRPAAVDALAEEMIVLFGSRERLRETLAAYLLRNQAQQRIFERLFG